jgi:crossover junction endodeoxyribonuclease RusA
LWGNARSAHWGRRHEATKLVREAVVVLGRHAKIPKADFLTVELIWAPGDRRPRDPNNLAPMSKACCDALGQANKNWVHLGLVPDDSKQYMAQLSPTIEDPPHPPGMWLKITLGRITSQ